MIQILIAALLFLATQAQTGTENNSDVDSTSFYMGVGSASILVILALLALKFLHRSHTQLTETKDKVRIRDSIREVRDSITKLREEVAVNMKHKFPLELQKQLQIQVNDAFTGTQPKAILIANWQYSKHTKGRINNLTTPKNDIQSFQRICKQCEFSCLAKKNLKAETLIKLFDLIANKIKVGPLLIFYSGHGSV